jgi:hypothetical protein
MFHGRIETRCKEGSKKTEEQEEMIFAVQSGEQIKNRP